MIDGVPVVDAVVHPYNLAASNVSSPLGEAVRQGFYAIHAQWNPPEHTVPAELFLTDQDIDTLAATLWLESDVDVAVYHTLRLDSLFTDGLCSEAKNLELHARWPDRVVGYVGLDPTLGVERSLDELDAQLDRLPGAVGLKVYPDQVAPYRTYRMDDPEACFPIWERAQARGLKVVAVHKALPNGPVPLGPYRIDDVEGAAMAFPGLNFEVVHAGMAFVEETALALARFPNVYANLEVTAQLLWKAPRLFQEALATFLFWGGPTKVIWADGAHFTHPQVMLERMWDLQLDEDLLERRGLPQLDRDLKARILGRNWADMAGVDLDARVAAASTDEWARRRASTGRLEPYSSWRAAPVTAAAAP